MCAHGHGNVITVCVCGKGQELDTFLKWFEREDNINSLGLGMLPSACGLDSLQDCFSLNWPPSYQITYLLLHVVLKVVCFNLYPLFALGLQGVPRTSKSTDSASSVGSVRKEQGDRKSHPRYCRHQCPQHHHSFTFPPRSQQPVPSCANSSYML